MIVEPAPVVVDNRAAGRYEALVAGQVAAYTAYRAEGDRVVFLYTVVVPVAAHRRIGRRLVEAALADLRSRGVAAVAVCPFVHRVLAEHDPAPGPAVE